MATPPPRPPRRPSPRTGRQSGRTESGERARGRGLADIALCSVLFYAGLRRSEAAALAWGDVEASADGSGLLAIRRSKTDPDRELVREKLGVGRVTGIDFGTPRLLCVAGEFPRQDQTAAKNSRRRVELLRYRRYGDAYVAVEWVYGGETIDPAPEPAGPPRRTTSEERASVAPHLSRSSTPGAGEDPDYSVYPGWVKASEESPAILRMGGLAGVGWDRLAFGRAVEGQLRGDQGGWEGRPGGPGCIARAVACSRTLPGAPPPLGSGRARRWPDGLAVAS